MKQGRVCVPLMALKQSRLSLVPASGDVLVVVGWMMRLLTHCQGPDANTFPAYRLHCNL